LLDVGECDHRNDGIIRKRDVVTPLDRFATLVQRELEADGVEVLDADAEFDGTAVACALDDGRIVVARFSQPPSDREATRRRLEMLVRTFAEALKDQSPPEETRPSQPPDRASVGPALDDVLRELATRVSAVHAFVIDADSPIVWGVSTGTDLPARDLDAHLSTSDPPSPARAALETVRVLPALARLRKGRHMRLVLEDNETTVFAESFLGIYVLVLVLERKFVGLNVQMAVSEWIPRIERLVRALPPLDPTPAPMAGVIPLRRRRR
jgi:hypothetical protein